MQTKGKSVIFLGDSITYGIGASCESNAWVNIVSAEAGFFGYNFGICGTRIAPQINATSKGVAEWNESFVERVDRLPSSADLVIIFGGTNDYGHGDAPLGRFGDSEANTFYGAMDTLFFKLLKKYPKAKIVLLTPIHRTEETKYFNEFGVRNCGTLEDYVNAEMEVAKKYNIPILDLYHFSGICPDIEENRKQYTVDGLHPNDKGHQIIAEKVLFFIKNSL